MLFIHTRIKQYRLSKEILLTYLSVDSLVFLRWQSIIHSLRMINPPASFTWLNLGVLVNAQLCKWTCYNNSVHPHPPTHTPTHTHTQTHTHTYTVLHTHTNTHIHTHTHTQTHTHTNTYTHTHNHTHAYSTYYMFLYLTQLGTKALLC